MNATTKKLNKLTNTVTAFRTWDELLAAMGTPENQVYCPTIYMQDSRSKKLLALAIAAAGYTVYCGNSKWLNRK